MSIFSDVYFCVSFVLCISHFLISQKFKKQLSNMLK